MPLITQQQLARVASKAAPHIVNAIVDHADDVLPRYGIVTPLRIQHFLAQVFIETGYLRHLEEDLSYTAARLVAVWPKRFPTVAAATPYAHRPEALAAVVYGGRMGNKTPEEAFANRGLGLLMSTGADNRRALAKRLGVTVDQLRSMLTSDEWMLECAAAIFEMLGCIPHADHDDVAGVTRAINGGLNGLADRQAALKLCKRVWTASAVIAPAALVPKPQAPGEAPVTPEQTRLLTAFEKMAASPTTVNMAQRVIAGAARGIAAQPDTGILAGKKTYLIAGLGIASTLVTVGFAMMQNGGMTWTGYLAAITALVTSGGFAMLRLAVKGHYGELADIMLGVGQQVVMEVAQQSVASAAQTVIQAPEAAIVAVGDAASAAVDDMTSTLGSLIPR